MALSALVGLVCAGFLIEGRMHRRALKRIRYRIHVNGTRGKSSVARLIAAGLRGGGIQTCAKTTGTTPRMIFPDAKELPIFRPGRTNIIEQKRVVRAAVNANAEALVIECMALQPILQSTCELQLVQSTHSVITNARADHLDVMGPTRLDVASALAGTVCRDGKVFTAEQRRDALDRLRWACRDRGSSLHEITDHDSASVTNEELSQFSYFEHADNVALALAVCNSLGVDRQSALKGMWSATPDCGAMKIHECLVVNRTWHFANGFAANDPESTGSLWQLCCGRYQPCKRVVVMNCRVDRPDRSKIMGQAMGQWCGPKPGHQADSSQSFSGLGIETKPDLIVVVGTGTDLFLRAALDAGVESDRIACLGTASPREILEMLADDQRLTVGPNPDSSGSCLLMGVGNIYGCGGQLDEFFRNNPIVNTAQSRNDNFPTHRIANPSSTTHI